MRVVTSTIGLTAVLLLSMSVMKAGAETIGEILESKEWTITWLMDSENEIADGATVVFGPNGQLSGYGGCNRLMGTFNVDETEGMLAISNIARTRKLCARPIMTFEKSLIEKLQMVTVAKIDPEGVVTLINTQGQPLLVLN